MERPGAERLALAGLALAAVAIPLAVSASALVVRAAGGTPRAPLAAVSAALVLAALAALAAARGRGPLVGLARRLPAGLDGVAGRRRGRTVGFALVALLALAQIARLSAFMSDPALTWGSAFPPVEEGTRHMCLGAYVQAAELSRRGDPNIYASEHFPAFTETPGHRAPPPPTSVANLGPYIQDPYEYPPVFLLLPRAALLLTNDFLSLRTAWFGLQVSCFLVFALVLAGAVGGRRGLVAALLLPVAWLALPLMFNFQFGQFHLAAVMLALGGMLAFERGRERTGGALLAAAVVTKLFPGLLLVYLAARRRWRPVAWTVAFGAGYAALGLLVLGWAPHRAFLQYHLPRISSGEAFSFFTRNDLTLAANYGVYGLPFKLARLGVPGMSAALGSALSWLYSLVLLAAAVVAARRRHPPALEPAVWLALLVLGSLRSPLAPNVYTLAPAAWLLTLVAADARLRRQVALVVVAFVVMGNVPPFPRPEATILGWMTGQVAMFALGFWVALRRPEGVASA
jgi:hypothetical protein